MPQKKCHNPTESFVLPEPDYYIDSNGLPNILNKKKKKHRLKYTNFQQNLLSKKLLNKRQQCNGINMISICGSKEDSNKMIELFNDNCSNATNHDSNAKLVSQEMENVLNDKKTKDICNQKIKNMLDFECDLNR